MLEITRTSGSNRFACLTYHVIGDGPDQYTLAERILREQLNFLRSKNFLADDFEGLERRLCSGSVFPEKYVVLSVDDGHKSSMRAAEIFGGAGYRATFFITRDRSLKKPGYMRDADIRELRRAGFSIGAHGATHRKLTFLPESECIEELECSKTWLEQVLGETVRYMAAPGGYVNARVLQLARSQGYTLTGTCSEWMNSQAQVRRSGAVNRVNVRQHFSATAFRRIVEGDSAFYARRQLRAAALWLPKQFLRAY